MANPTCASGPAVRASDPPVSTGTEGDAHLVHTLAERESWPWLPTRGPAVLAPHPYCVRCGQVKAVGSARALDRGGLVNLLAALQRRLRDHNLTMTEVQRRLIHQRLVAGDAADPFGLTRDQQMDIVARTAAPVLGLHRDVVASYLCSC